MEKDITSSVRVVKTLEEAKDKLEEYLDIFNSLPVGIYRTNISDGCFLKANPECAAMLGYENQVDLIANAKSGDFYYDQEERRRFINLLKKNGSIRHYEMPLQDAKGNRMWVAITARISQDGEYLEGSLMDITESRRVADELERYKVEEGNRLSKINQAAKRRVEEIDTIMCNGHDNIQELL